MATQAQIATRDELPPARVLLPRVRYHKPNLKANLSSTFTFDGSDLTGHRPTQGPELSGPGSRPKCGVRLHSTIIVAEGVSRALDGVVLREREARVTRAYAVRSHHSPTRPWEILPSFSFAGQVTSFPERPVISHARV